MDELANQIIVSSGRNDPEHVRKCEAGRQNATGISTAGVMPARRLPNSMNEPVIICPKYREEIKLTESLAAPLVEATRQQYEAKLARQESEIERREVAIREAQLDVSAGVWVAGSRDHNRSAIYEWGIFGGDRVAFGPLLGLISMWSGLLAGA
jgi:hypothetical protein